MRALRCLSNDTIVPSSLELELAMHNGNGYIAAYRIPEDAAPALGRYATPSLAHGVHACGEG